MHRHAGPSIERSLPSVVEGELSAINWLISADDGVQSECVILFQSGCCLGGEGSALRVQIFARSTRRAEPQGHDTVYLTFTRAEQPRSRLGRACAGIILRRCPICVHDSVVGHGRRRKQAHDEHQIGSGFAAAFGIYAARHSRSCRHPRRPIAITA